MCIRDRFAIVFFHPIRKFSWRFFRCLLRLFTLLRKLRELKFFTPNRDIIWTRLDRFTWWCLYIIRTFCCGLLCCCSLVLFLLLLEPSRWLFQWFLHHFTLFGKFRKLKFFTPDWDIIERVTGSCLVFLYLLFSNTRIIQ